MKVTYDNINNIEKSRHDQTALEGCLYDIEDINKVTGKEFYINWQDWHNEYSAERTDPCPDFYGTYTVRINNKDNDAVGPICATVNDLEDIIWTMTNTLEVILGREI